MGDRLLFLVVVEGLILVVRHSKKVSVGGSTQRCIVKIKGQSPISDYPFYCYAYTMQ